MADVSINQNSETLDISDRFDGYTRVLIRTGLTDANGKEITYAAGNQSGRTLEIDNPWADDTVAKNILAKIQGWAYQPFNADSAIMNPASEIGDSVVVGNTFSGIYKADTRFTQLFNADIAAPNDEEIDHEYAWEESKERKYERKLNAAVARLDFYADQIIAKVDRESERTSFGWKLQEDSWRVFNQNGDIFKVDENGASVKGEIKADTGTIAGFTIGRNGIFSNAQTIDGQETYGLYIGPDGIQIGQNFHVDNDGNVTANNGTFNGTVYAGQIVSGGNAGYLDGGAISSNTLDFGQLTYGVNTSLGYADLFNSATTKGSNKVPEYFCADTVSANTGMLSPEYWVYDARTNAAGSLKGHTHIVTVEGDTVTIGAPDFSGTEYSFKIAPQIGDVTISLDGGATWNEGYGTYGRYVIHIRATDGSGKVIGRGDVYLIPDEAYSKGEDSVDVDWSGGDYDIWATWYRDEEYQIYGYRLNAKLTNGKQRQTDFNYL